MPVLLLFCKVQFSAISRFPADSINGYVASQLALFPSNVNDALSEPPSFRVAPFSTVNNAIPVAVESLVIVHFSCATTVISPFTVIVVDVLSISPYT